MKKFARILTVAVMAALALFLVSCSSYNKILKAFEKEGYEEVEETSGLNGLIENILNEASEDGESDIKVTVHILSKSIVDSVAILEFNGTDDLYDFIEESETLKGIVKDAQNSDYINGNCIFISMSLNTNALNIFKNA